MTCVVILIHPNGLDGRPVVLNKCQQEALKKTFENLRSFVGRRRVAVLASPATSASCHARLAAAFYGVEPLICEGLLRDGSLPDLTETCGCVEDFLDPNVGLAIAIVAPDIAERLAGHVAKLNQREARAATPRATRGFIIPDAQSA
jgi:hypothetical protein